MRRWLNILFMPNYDKPGNVNLEEANPWWLPRPDLVLIHGYAPGVDTLADDWGVSHWVKTRRYPADLEKYGRSAGPIRNRQMVKEGRPHLVVAFHGGQGTADMKNIAREHRIPILEIPYPDAVFNEIQT